MTPGSQRNRIRSLLRRGEVTPETVVAYAATHPPSGLPTEPQLYGAQRRRAGLPRLTARREILYGPERRPPVPRPRGPSAREILARNPDIRAFLQPNRMLKPKPLQAKFRKLHRTGRISEHVLNPPPHQPAQVPVFQDISFTGRRAIRKFMVVAEEGFGLQDFLAYVRQATIDLMDANRRTKVNLDAHIKVHKIDAQAGDTLEDISAELKSGYQVLDQLTPVDEIFDQAVAKMEESLATYLRGGSGWSLSKVVSLVITFLEYRPFRGSSFIKLPKGVRNNKGVLNVKNKDDQCFRWAVTMSLNPDLCDGKDPGRVTKKIQEASGEYDFTDIEFPTPVCEATMRKFETNNPGIMVSLLGYENVYDAATERTNTIYHPMRPSPVRLDQLDGETNWDYQVRVSKHHVRLLVATGTVERPGPDGTIETFNKNHFCVVRSMSKMLASQVSGKKAAKYFCDYCLDNYGTQALLDTHQVDCSKNLPQSVVMPGEDNCHMRFKNIQNVVPAPFYIVADFESNLEDANEKRGKTTVVKQHHVPSAFCLHLHSRVESFQMDPIVRAKTCEEDADMDKAFVEAVASVATEIGDRFPEPVPMVFGAEEQSRHDEQDTCYACGNIFVEEMEENKKKKWSKVRDHCHYTGRYRGALHNSCSLRLKKVRTIPVIFHNLKGYDSHLFVKRLADIPGAIGCIANNEQKYITFHKDITVGPVGGDTMDKIRLKFIDSASFLLSSLESLVANLKGHGGSAQFHALRQYYSGKQLELLLRKGVYPYDYMNSTSRMTETQLPPKEQFYSKLNEEHISDADYTHAQEVWVAFGCETMADYARLYCKSDVLQLADVWENFVQLGLEAFGLDPSYYVSLPGYSWDAMLKTTKVDIPLLTDKAMYEFFEKGVRGGVSTVTGRYARANNKHMTEYDPSKESSFISYVDANSLYPYAMKRKLPLGDFRWLGDSERDEMMRDHDLIRACTLEVDLEYPKELHDRDNDYPMAPESIRVNATDPVPKLTPNFNTKSRYVVHHEVLRYYLSRGLKLTAIHRGVSYSESNFFSSFIDLCVSRRAQATSKFEKDFWKLCMNAVYGKCLQKVRDRCKVVLVNGNDRVKLLKLIAKPTFQQPLEYRDSELVSVLMKQRVVTLNMPVFLGASVLYHAKLHMYRHHDYVKEKWGGDARLLFTDTDSLCYHIRTEDWFSDIRPDLSTVYDMSDYPKDHPLHSTENKKIVGFFKDEAAGRQITEFVGLRAKSYSYMLDGGEECKKSKGVKRSVIKNATRHEEYKRCLFGVANGTEADGELPGTTRKTYREFKSRNHDITTNEVSKIALSAMDNKRVIIPNDLEGRTRAIGHWRNTAEQNHD
jgi:hypothetical protein